MCIFFFLITYNKFYTKFIFLNCLIQICIFACTGIVWELISFFKHSSVLTKTNGKNHLAIEWFQEKHVENKFWKLKCHSSNCANSTVQAKIKYNFSIKSHFYSRISNFYCVRTKAKQYLHSYVKSFLDEWN